MAVSAPQRSTYHLVREVGGARAAALPSLGLDLGEEVACLLIEAVAYLDEVAELERGAPEADGLKRSRPDVEGAASLEIDGDNICFRIRGLKEMRDVSVAAREVVDDPWPPSGTPPQATA